MITLGADIHITVGRVAPKLTGSVPDEVTAVGPAVGTALAVFNNKRFQFGDFEFDSDIPNEVDLYRNYALFSFLAAVRGSVRPIIPLEALEKATSEFIDWINSEHRRIEHEAVKGSWYSDPDDFIGGYGRYDVGDHSRVFYPVAVLVGFNYDDVAIVEHPDSAWNNPIYVRDEENTTYRDMFGDQYFKFLNWCVQTNWQFVIFGFDN